MITRRLRHWHTNRERAPTISNLSIALRGVHTLSACRRHRLTYRIAGTKFGALSHTHIQSYSLP